MNGKIYKKISALALVLVVVTMTLSFTKATDNITYKCMIQMINYTGEKAYVIVSLINPEGDYETTLYVQGDDEEWYSDMIQWWSFFDKKRHDIDAITGATIGNGERQISVIEIEKAKIDAGYSIRFETAVENQEYYVKDVEIALNSTTIRNKANGSGYIRYVRMIPN